MPYKSRKKRRHRNGKITVFAVVLMCIVIFIGLCVFLRVSEIEIVGLEKYGDKDIITASGIETGDSLLLMRESNADISIRKKFPYIENVRIKRELPNKIVITVTESTPVAYVPFEGSFWKLDKNCRLLERTDGSGVSGLIRLTGVSPVSPSEGQTIFIGNEDEAKVGYIKSILCAASDKELVDGITRLDAENIARFSFDYGTKLTVLLGSGAEIDAKFSMISRILEDCADSYGTIDVSNPKEGHFIPS